MTVTPFNYTVDIKTVLLKGLVIWKTWGEGKQSLQYKYKKSHGLREISRV
jgi:hypothetical protein